jgi:thiamine-monophosphate kinase
MQWAISTDTLIEGRHFLSTVAPDRLGHKALAVNLSDLAACGASPVAFTLALALPRVDDDWLAGFADGLFALADAHGIELVGGDTTAGALTLNLTVFGEVPNGAALLRSGARPGDDLWVSGTLGDARLALEGFRGNVDLPGEVFSGVRRALERPEPRVALGLALRGVASAAIDLSDGLLGDLGHVLERSGVGAEVDVADIPHSAALAAQPAGLRRRCLLAGGDDYELLFTAPADRRAAVSAAAQLAGVPVHNIGRMVSGRDLIVRDEQGQALDLAGFQAFDHFKFS